MTVSSAPPTSVGWETLESADAVTPEIARQWDDLAVQLDRPFCAPAWILAWRHIAPADSQLRIVIVRDGERLIAVAPFYTLPWRPGLWTWSLVGSNAISRIEPLAAPPDQDSAAAAIRAALAAGDPEPARIRLEGLPSDSPWPQLLAGPGTSDERPGWTSGAGRTPAPTVSLENCDSVDDFLRRRSPNFRQQMRRFRRKLDKDGAEFRLARTTDELETAMGDLVRLHHARWDDRGGSASMTERTDRMLLEAGRNLGPDRFRLVSLVLDGKTINSQLFIAAGGEISYWNGGFDENYAHYRPSMVALVDAIRASIEAGYRRFDLGPGGHAYKYRLADDEDTLAWTTLIPRGRQYLRARAAYAPQQARHDAARLLTPEQKKRVRELIRRPAP